MDEVLKIESPNDDDMCDIYECVSDNKFLKEYDKNEIYKSNEYLMTVYKECLRRLNEADNS
jgi:hypothetical protein